MNREAHILAIDDEQHFLDSLQESLVLRGYRVSTHTNTDKAIAAFSHIDFGLVLLDVKMPVSGIDVLSKIKHIKPEIPVIMISGQSDISAAVSCIKLGAYDFVEKPIVPEKLFTVINNAIDSRRLTRQNNLLREELLDKYRLIGQSKAMRELYASIDAVAATNASVLIRGESGTGKELIASALHYNSPRKDEAFIKVNCAAIPKDLLESELFGHKKGSFTGAHRDREGKFAAADKGTLFLDEIGDMPLELQAKILRILESGEVEVVGSNQVRSIDVRIVSATNKNLEHLLEANSFREDLFHRLNVVSLYAPALRDRKSDIGDLVEAFIRQFNNSYNRAIAGATEAAIAMLAEYNWPGNVRELKNIVENLVLYCRQRQIDSALVLAVLQSKKK
jgi:DNA-binding NtrC family response regulator